MIESAPGRALSTTGALQIARGYSLARHVAYTATGASLYAALRPRPKRNYTHFKQPAALAPLDCGSITHVFGGRKP